MNKIEESKKKLELAKVKCAMQEMEHKILMRLEDIERIKADMEIQDAKIKELENELQGR
jgi:hypothetical protein